MFDTYVKLKVENKKAEQLLNMFSDKKITVYDLKYIEVKKENTLDYITFNIKEEDFKLAVKILNRLKIEVISSKKYGTGLIVSFFRCRVILFAMLILIIPTLYWRMSFLKKIHITGNENISLDSIYVTLRENNIRAGMKTKDIDTGYLENKFYIKFKNLKFITFTLTGTNLYIEIVDYELDE